jgi:hypothetical protein
MLDLAQKYSLALSLYRQSNVRLSKLLRKYLLVGRLRLVTRLLSAALGLTAGGVASSVSGGGAATSASGSRNALTGSVLEIDARFVT